MNMAELSPLVSVCCLVYNHESYIRQCIDGFMMQKTDFAFEVLIHDDASTDRTANIIREYEVKYPEIIKPIYQTENQYSKGISIGINYQYPRAKGKYIALCEGDDYWTDPLKLQKQVDFLEANPEYGMVYTRARQYMEKKKMFSEKLAGKNYETFENLLTGNTIPTLTVLFRKYFLKSYQNEISPSTKQWKMGDYPLWLYIAANSKIKYISDVTGVYRILPESASHFEDFNKGLEFINNTYEIRSFFLSFANKHNNQKHYYRKFNESRLIEVSSILLKDNKLTLKNYTHYLYRYRIFSLRIFFIYLLIILPQGKNYLKKRWSHI
jgi:glycosyltransferase involved in cell wall biosynthesis